MGDASRQFGDFETTVCLNGQWVPIRVTGAALHALWGAGIGPQDGEGLFQAYRHLFEAILAEKPIPSSFAGTPVTITDADLDM